ncbi:MAG TPA: hypothetical protein VGD57_07975 [Candidatus Dormibacteraeota bacterium]|jgi:hypothetical protein
MTGYPAPPTSGPLQPRTYSLSELLDTVFKVYRRNFELFASISLLLALPDVFLLLAGFHSLSGLLRFFLAPYVLATLYLASAQVMLRGPASASDILVAGFRRYGNFAGVYARLILAALALIIPPLGIWLLVRWAPAASVLAAEPVKPKEAVRRSALLVTGFWWRTFGIMIVIALLEFILSLILGLSAGIGILIIPGLDLLARALAVNVVATILGSLVVPLVPIGYTLLYIDLRVRKEGLDLDSLAKSASDAA